MLTCLTQADSKNRNWLVFFKVDLDSCKFEGASQLGDDANVAKSCEELKTILGLTQNQIDYLEMSVKMKFFHSVTEVTGKPFVLAHYDGTICNEATCQRGEETHLYRFPRA